VNPLAEKLARTQSDLSDEFPSERLVDVVVVGGGPAGTATAIALARAGRSVTVLERSHYEPPRIGETLPPEIKQPLITLGLWRRFLADGHVESPGIAVAWGQSKLYDNDFIVNPLGPGWHVDRCRFDSMLARFAEECGVELLPGVRQITLTRELSRTWHLRARVRGQPAERRAAVLVDATGRAASPARRLGGHRIVYDRLIGLVGFIPVGAAGSTSDLRTLIEAVKCGWWYSAPLPDGRQVAAFMTDADLLPPGTAARAGFWRDQLRQSSRTQIRIGHNAPAIGPRVVSACSSRSQALAGDGWLAVGDAATALDPLSSQGALWALESGLAAASAINRLLQGNRRALDDYARQLEAGFDRYLRTRADYYRRERRWASAAFWRRRHVPATARRTATPLAGISEKNAKSS
jgi:flavin-dependent dehydrogenase